MFYVSGLSFMSLPEMLEVFPSCLVEAARQTTSEGLNPHPARGVNHRAGISV